MNDQATLTSLTADFVIEEANKGDRGPDKYGNEVFFLKLTAEDGTSYEGVYHACKPDNSPVVNERRTFDLEKNERGWRARNPKPEGWTDSGSSGGGSSSGGMRGAPSPDQAGWGYRTHPVDSGRMARCVALEAATRLLAQVSTEREKVGELPEATVALAGRFERYIEEGS